MTIPAIGTTATGRSGSTPAASTTASTGTTPAPIATAVQPKPGPRRGTPIRRAEVTAATANIRSTNSAVHQPERRTATITSETAASWTAARTAADTIARPRPSPPSHSTAAPSATNSTSTAPSAGPTTIAPFVTPGILAQSSTFAHITTP